MKKLHKNILFAAAVLAMPSALADIPESSVPAAAVSSIKGAYPNAGPIEWDSEMHGMERIYEAEFRINGNSCFLSSGSRPCVRFEALSGMPD